MASEFVGLLVELFLLLVAAQLVGWLFEKLKQPAVIGEVLAGVLIGPALLGLVHEGEILDFISELGAIFLLFLVGVETRLRDILGVGVEALAVGVIGVIGPFVFGWWVALQMGFAQVPSLFVGTALVATSVGITARVLQELEALSEPFSRIILGAAVIDDVLGLIVLAIVSGIAAQGEVIVGEIVRLVVFSGLFVVGSAMLVPLSHRLPLDKIPFRSPLGFALALGVGMAALSAVIGLAPIVGAFFAGMLIAEIEANTSDLQLEHSIHGAAALLTPVFFGVVGLKLDITVLTEPTVVLFGSILTVVATLGKLLGGFGAMKRGIREALVVGTGMVPRGEVGLIVVALGLSSGAVNDTEYAIVLFVVIATTLLAPLALRPLIRWSEAEEPVDEPPSGATPDLPDHGP